MDRFTCEQVFRRLNDYLDRQLTASEIDLVEEHLKTCALCAAEYVFEASVLNAVREKVRHVQAPPDLLARVSQALTRAHAALPEE